MYIIIIQIDKQRKKNGKTRKNEGKKCMLLFYSFFIQVWMAFWMEFATATKYTAFFLFYIIPITTMSYYARESGRKKVLTIHHEKHQLNVLTYLFQAVEAHEGSMMGNGNLIKPYISNFRHNLFPIISSDRTFNKFSISKNI